MGESGTETMTETRTDRRGKARLVRGSLQVARWRFFSYTADQSDTRRVTLCESMCKYNNEKSSITLVISMVSAEGLEPSTP